MKKLLSMLLALALLLGCLCSTALAADFAVPENGYDGSEVTIRFYHQMGDKLKTVMNTYIEEFNKLYPNIHIEHTALGDYDGVRDQVTALLPKCLTMTGDDLDAQIEAAFEDAIDECEYAN